MREKYIIYISNNNGFKLIEYNHVLVEARMYSYIRIFITNDVKFYWIVQKASLFLSKYFQFKLGMKIQMTASGWFCNRQPMLRE